MLFVGKLEKPDADVKFHWSPEQWQEEVIGCQSFTGRVACLSHLLSLELTHVKSFAPRGHGESLPTGSSSSVSTLETRDSGHLAGRSEEWDSLRAEDVSASTEVGMLIHKAAQTFPKEIQALICNMVPKGLASSLITCLDTLDWVIMIKKRP